MLAEREVFGIAYGLKGYERRKPLPLFSIYYLVKLP
jgi:hypothetical protein